MFGLPDINGSVLDCDPFEIVRPLAVVENGDECWDGVDDRVSKLLAPLVTVTSCAASGVRFPPGCDDQCVAFKVISLCFNLELVARLSYFQNGLFWFNRSARGQGKVDEGVSDVNCLVADGKDLSCRFDFGFDTLALDFLNDFFGRQCRKG